MTSALYLEHYLDGKYERKVEIFEEGNICIKLNFVDFD